MRVAQSCSPRLHQSLHSLYVGLVSWIGREIRRLVRISRQVEQQTMIDLRVDVELPLAVANGSLVILKWKEQRVANALSLPIHDWREVS